MKPIGGFFELERSTKQQPLQHQGALALSTGRACLSFIVETIHPKRLHVPFYCCDSILQPLAQNSVPVLFYKLNHKLEVAEDIKLRDDDYLLYINYFGLKSTYIQRLISIFGKRLIVDNTHAFFEKRLRDVYSFNSARKWFGVPDGAFLYTPDVQKEQRPIPRNNEITTKHLLNRLNGRLSVAYRQFLEYERSIGSSVRRISHFSERRLRRINFERVKRKRKRNFRFLDANFAAINRFAIDQTKGIPFCYPLQLKRSIDRQTLAKDLLFVPTLWRDVIERRGNFTFEKMFSSQVLPLPIDHRYGLREMKLLTQRIKNLVRID